VFISLNIYVCSRKSFLAEMKINKKELSDIRLNYQSLSEPDEDASVVDVVRKMCAMQAQDFTAAKWAIACRANGLSEQDITNAYDKGEILRTHLLRPTWHFIAAEDIRWLLKLTAPHIRSVLKYRDHQLGITRKDLEKSSKLFEKFLSQDEQLTVSELKHIFEKEGMDVHENSFYHYAMHAELNEQICSGSLEGKEVTYALMDERVLVAKEMPREEAVAELISRYFRSRGVATLPDFLWWSGLPAKDARAGLESIRGSLETFETEGETYFLFSGTQKIIKRENLLLPAFDEFLISYRSRKWSIPNDVQPTAISSNGIFRPVVVVDGQVAGIWKRTAKGKRYVLELTLFGPIAEKDKGELVKRCEEYGVFTGVETAINIVNR